MWSATPARGRSAAVRLAPAAGAQNSSRDFDALSPLTGCGKPDELAAALAFWWRLRRKEVTRQPREIGICVRLAALGREAAFLKLRDRARIGVGNGGECSGRCFQKGPQEFSFSIRLERHIE